MQREEAFAAPPPPIPSENDHSTSCQSTCLHRRPCRKPWPQRLRFENTLWIQSRISCADASPTATTVWFSSPSQPTQPSVTIHVSGAVASLTNTFSVGPDWSIILRSLTRPGLIPSNTSTARRSSAGPRGCARPWPRSKPKPPCRRRSSPVPNGPRPCSAGEADGRRSRNASLANRARRPSQ